MAPSVNGIELGPGSPLLAGAPAGRLERAEVDLCDDLIARISGREGVVNLSQGRASMLTRGIPDRRYRAHGQAFFWEAKRESGKLTNTQHLFLLAELQHGALAGCGTLDDLNAFIGALVAPKRTHATLERHCLELITRWAAKGYRPERRPRHRRRGAG